MQQLPLIELVEAEARDLYQGLSLTRRLEDVLPRPKNSGHQICGLHHESLVSIHNICGRAIATRRSGGPIQCRKEHGAEDPGDPLLGCTVLILIQAAGNPLANINMLVRIEARKGRPDIVAGYTAGPKECW